jgi:two-component system, LuxR family, response regulator FixJ
MPFDQKLKLGSEHDPAMVYVVDDSTDVRAAIEVLLNSVNLRTKTFASGEEFLASVDPTARGCLLLDMRMPGMSGLEVQDLLKERSVSLPIIFLTGHGEVSTAVQAMRDGAMDYIEKPFHPQFLLDRIHTCLKLDEEISGRSFRRQEARNRVKRLSPREYEIAKLIVEGMPSKRIAASFQISEKTVDVHRHNIFKKVSIRSVAELVPLWMDAQPEID